LPGGACMLSEPIEMRWAVCERAIAFAIIAVELRHRRMDVALLG